MCGFTIAILNKHSVARYDITTKIRRSLENISHRGPDSTNILINGAVTFGHCRLSIIDLDVRSNQPLTSEGNRYHIVFNGEIYNYLDLKLELDNWKFQTKSDTEVILAAYDKWGMACFSRFVGQFAVCIFDVRKNQLVFSRDMMGEKPLYVHSNENGLFYSSEIRGLMPFFTKIPKIKFSAFNDYLHYQYIPEPDCIIESITKIEAGSIVSVDLNTMMSRHETFWSWQTPKIDTSPVSFPEIEKQIRTAVEYSLVADVPIALGLSAGLDSAAIALFAKESGKDLATYTIGYPGKPSYDERDGARLLSKHLGLQNVQVEIDPDDFVDSFEQYCNALSEPIADTAGYGHYIVPKTIAKYGHKVMLSGIGGDELFWGYEWTRLAVLFEELVRFRSPEAVVKLLRKAPKLLKFIFMMSRSRKVPETLRPYFRLLFTSLVCTTPKDQSMFMGISGAPEFTSLINTGINYYPDIEGKVPCVYRHTKNIISTAMESHEIIINLLCKLNRTWLISNCVQLADTLSMSNSIESRAPFLNSNLIKTMLAYNTQNRPDRQGGKSVLRRVMENKLPEEILHRPKSGFVTPVAKWIDLLEERYAELVNNGKLVDQGIIKKDFFKIYDPNNITLHTKYRIILLEQWYSNLIKRYAC